MYPSQHNPPETTRSRTRFLAYGIIFGSLIGVMVGDYFDYQILPIIISIIICMVLGYIRGKSVDKKINDQLKDKAYAFKSKDFDEKSQSFRVTIVDKRGKEKVLSIKKDKFKSMDLKKMELVYLDDRENISPAYSHTRQEKHKSLLDIMDAYKNLKKEKEKMKKEKNKSGSNSKKDKDRA